MTLVTDTAETQCREPFLLWSLRSEKLQNKVHFYQKLQRFVEKWLLCFNCHIKISLVSWLSEYLEEDTCSFPKEMSPLWSPCYLTVVTASLPPALTETLTWISFQRGPPPRCRTCCFTEPFSAVKNFTLGLIHFQKSADGCTSGKVVSMGLSWMVWKTIVVLVLICHLTIGTILSAVRLNVLPVCLGEWLTAPLALLCLCQCYSRAIGEKLFNVT